MSVKLIFVLIVVSRFWYHSSQEGAVKHNGCIDVRFVKGKPIIAHTIATEKARTRYMMALTHKIGGIAAGTAIANVLHTDTCNSGIIIAAAIVGCLLPDIDNSKSSISRKWSLISLFVSAGQGIIRIISSLFPIKQREYIRSLIGHRGLTHSLVPVVMMPGIVLLVGTITGYRCGYMIALGLTGGIISHLFLDMLAGGVPLLMPFTTKRLCLARIKTGGFLEWIFRCLLIIVFLHFGLEVINIHDMGRHSSVLVDFVTNNILVWLNNLLV